MRFAVLMTGLFVATPSLAGQVCPAPAPNLQSGNPNVEARSLSFANDNKSYTLDIYSAYAPQFQGPGAPWCIRYEAENTSQFDIEKFSLPAGPLQADPLPIGGAGRQGVAVTRPPSNKPSVSDTVVYAFKSVVLRTSVYQVAIQLDSHPPRLYASATPNLGGAARSALHLNVRLAGYGKDDSSYGLAEHVLVREPTELPVVGADYAGSETTMNVASKASYNGKQFRISVGLEVKGRVKEIQAPYFWILDKAKFPDDMLRFIRGQSIDAPIPLDARVEKEFQADAVPSRLLYLVDQPVTLTRVDGGRVCILAPAYSPVPIPSSALSCNLVH